jgi:peptide/nickel transport system substrate-binding protein
MRSSLRSLADNDEREGHDLSRTSHAPCFRHSERASAREEPAVAIDNRQLTIGNAFVLGWSLLTVLLLISSASAETRPRYGRVLRVEMRAALSSLDPAAVPTSKDPGFAQIASLVYDTLVRLDATGRVFPNESLAECQPENERSWRCSLRSGVRFSDGTVLTPMLAAQSLHESNPGWNLRAGDDALIIESEQPLPNLPAVLALPRNSVVLRREGKLLGTGPFRVEQFQAGRRLALAAVEDGWHERPFVEAIEIQFNRAPRDQVVDLDLGRAELVEIAPDQLARLAGRRVFTSDPVELLALRFSHSNVRDGRVREAIALTVDRESIYSVLLQRRGEAAAGLLPNWMTGYSFLFAASPEMARARQLRAEAKQTAALTLLYDAADPLARLVAERIALNANEAGIILKTIANTQSIAVPDIELVRVRLASTDAATALAELSRLDRLALTTEEGGDRRPSSVEGVYRETISALQEHWAIPIAYLPVACAVSPRVHNWTHTRDGSWQLDSLWLGVAAELIPPAEVRRP